MNGPTSAAAPRGMPLDDEQLTRIEGWFARRGVPQLIEGYATEHRIDARAWPWLVLWIVVGTVSWWGVRPGEPTPADLLGIAVTLSCVGGGLALLRQIRRRVMWWTDRQLDVFDVFSIVPLVAVPSAIIKGSFAQGAIDGGRALIGITLVYFAVGLGLGAIAWWSVRRLITELAHIVALVARTLPVLLILVLFLIFTAELWEASHLLRGAEVAALLVLLLAIAALLVFTAFRAELPAIEADPRQTHESLASTPVAGVLDTTLSAPQPLTYLQRLNLTALVLLGQLMQSVFVAAMVGGFLVVFGLLVLPAVLQERWIGEAPLPVFAFDLLGDRRVLTLELLTVSVLLGGAVGLYFTGLAITDSAFRTTHFDRLMDEVRLLVGVRAIYAAAHPLTRDAGPQYSMGFFGAGTLLIGVGDLLTLTSAFVWVAQGAFAVGSTLVIVGAVTLRRERRRSATGADA